MNQISRAQHARAFHFNNLYEFSKSRYLGGTAFVLRFLYLPQGHFIDLKTGV
jgi:hypothetical protein